MTIKFDEPSRRLECKRWIMLKSIYWCAVIIIDNLYSPVTLVEELLINLVIYTILSSIIIKLDIFWLGYERGKLCLEIPQWDS